MSTYVSPLIIYVIITIIQTVFEQSSRAGKSSTGFTSVEKRPRESSERRKDEKQQERTNNRAVAPSAKTVDVDEDTEDHPWYRTTEMQQVIAENGSELMRKVEGKEQRYKSKVGNISYLFIYLFTYGKRISFFSN